MHSAITAVPTVSSTELSAALSAVFAGIFVGVSFSPAPPDSRPHYVRLLSYFLRIIAMIEAFLGLAVTLGLALAFRDLSPEHLHGVSRVLWQAFVTSALATLFNVAIIFLPVWNAPKQTQ